jgi:hypothetical protein
LVGLWIVSIWLRVRRVVIVIWRWIRSISIGMRMLIRWGVGWWDESRRVLRGVMAIWRRIVVRPGRVLLATATGVVKLRSISSVILRARRLRIVLRLLRILLIRSVVVHEVILKVK